MNATAHEATETALAESVIAVAVVEDDAACRRAFAEAIALCGDMRLAWQAASLDEAQTLLPTTSLNVLLVDLGLPDGSGLGLIGRTQASQPECAVMVSTIFGDDAHVLSAVEAGAVGYLLKDVSLPQLMSEIRSLHAGGSPINPMVARKLLRRASNEAGEHAGQGEDSMLSANEATMLHLISRGHTLEEAAGRIGLSRHTAKTLVRHIYRKFQRSSRAGAVSSAQRQGLPEAR